MHGFGDLEAAIMDVMWAAPRRLAVRDVRKKLNEERDLAYTTVQTVMEILHRKGWLMREKQSRAYMYWATRSRADYVASLLDEVLDDSGDRTGVLLLLFERLDPLELMQLRAALDDLTLTGAGDRP
ncbi:BlaI/MecI/CopY family transcriptional regulator [Flindersiella endophytica]